MGLGTRKRYPNTVARRKMGASFSASNMLTRRTPIVVNSSVAGGHTITITFDQTVSLVGIPQILNDSLHLPTAAVRTAPNVVELTYADVTSTDFIVPFEDAAIRNNAAGYVLAGSYII